MVGEKSSSDSNNFSVLDCFDGSTGTLVCTVKEGVKLYSNNIRSTHVELARHKAAESALAEAMSQGLSAKDAAKQAEKEGKKAAKLVAKKADRVIGPFVSCVWDFMESIYYKGTVIEGLLRGTGTLVGTYAVGFYGEERFGRVGYLLGSSLGSWIGGKIGLMVNDVVNGMNYMLQFTQTASSVFSDSD